MVEALFWGSALLLLYTYLGYPALIGIWARLSPRLAVKGALEPSVSVLVAAHDEEQRIGQRLQNLLELDYPKDRLEIVVASDGSGDSTVARAREFADRGVSVRAFTERQGKACILNAELPKLRGEIVLLADARQTFARDVVRKLVRSFQDPQVGAVSGELVFTRDASDGGPASEGVDLYWKYEKFLRESESAVDSTIGATGAIYALRRELFEPIPPDTLLDDVIVPMRITRAGYRVLLEREAHAYDRVPQSADEEFTRKVRTIAGNFQLFARERWLLNPRRNRLWFQVVSHKLLRLVCPVLLIGCFLGALRLADRGLYLVAVTGQLCFYVAALIGWTMRDGDRAFRGVAVPYVFCLLQWTTMVAFVRFAMGRQAVTWDRADAPHRGPDPREPGS